MERNKEREKEREREGKGGELEKQICIPQGTCRDRLFERGDGLCVM